MESATFVFRKPREVTIDSQCIENVKVVSLPNWKLQQVTMDNLQYTN